MHYTLHIKHKHKAHFKKEKILQFTVLLFTFVQIREYVIHSNVKLFIFCCYCCLSLSLQSHQTTTDCSGICIFEQTSKRQMVFETVLNESASAQLSMDPKLCHLLQMIESSMPTEPQSDDKIATKTLVLCNKAVLVAFLQRVLQQQKAHKGIAFIQTFEQAEDLC
ncbi:hypothetical protein RFI_27331 [Reticulomyxa filosa]|uniref:Uncharacterized protein n=1 Tax=Reticulomyxa filosa TaxID=46433 RepID=X6M811_RETFI|nr:hypothetical protein RFI_27331 [Reticulomyxa filosa]|eukprot:ETO10049.1 hypothetical protein RFI_27331 [Reticulomyxa filosa]